VALQRRRNAERVDGLIAVRRSDVGSYAFDRHALLSYNPPLLGMQVTLLCSPLIS
jgi:hypothetical protein